MTRILILSWLIATLSAVAVHSFPSLQKFDKNVKHRSFRPSQSSYQGNENEILEQALPLKQQQKPSEISYNSLVVKPDLSLVPRRDDEKKDKMVLAELLVLAGAAANVFSVKKFGFFAIMMTGNFMRLWIALAEKRYREVGFYASVIGSYSVGAALFRFITLRHQQRGPKEAVAQRQNIFGVLALTALVLFSVPDLLLRFFSLPEKWLGCFMAMGFGFVNVISVDETATISWALTGYINKIMIALVDFVTLKKKTEGIVSQLRFLGIFVLSMLGTVLLWQYQQVLVPITRLLPPFGTCYGLFYATIFTWYGWKIQGHRLPIVGSNVWKSWVKNQKFPQWKNAMNNNNNNTALSYT